MNTGYVLIVDDDPDAREIQMEVVESLGLEARMAEDGPEALRLVQEQTPALILLDIMMPKMNGFVVLAKLRSMPRTRRIPVIFVTACGLSDRATLILPGVVDVVVKGALNVDQFRALLVRTLTPNHGTVTAARHASSITPSEPAGKPA